MNHIDQKAAGKRDHAAYRPPARRKLQRTTKVLSGHNFPQIAHHHSMALVKDARCAFGLAPEWLPRPRQWALLATPWTMWAFLSVENIRAVCQIGSLLSKTGRICDMRD